LEFEKEDFTMNQKETGAKVIVLGNEIAKSLFDESEPVGKM
jgi:putative ABC transport system permease protein